MRITLQYSPAKFCLYKILFVASGSVGVCALMLQYFPELPDMLVFVACFEAEARYSAYFEQSSLIHRDCGFAIFCVASCFHSRPTQVVNTYL